MDQLGHIPIAKAILEAFSFNLTFSVLDSGTPVK
jgi:hypothetical protein